MVRLNLLTAYLLSRCLTTATWSRPPIVNRCSSIKKPEKQKITKRFSLHPLTKVVRETREPNEPHVFEPTNTGDWESHHLTMTSRQYTSQGWKFNNLLLIWAMRLSENSPIPSRQRTKYRKPSTTSNSQGHSRGNTSMRSTSSSSLMI